MFPILTNEISNRFNEKYFQKLYDRKLQLSKIKQNSCSMKKGSNWKMNDVGKQRNGMDDQRLNTLLCVINCVLFKLITDATERVVVNHMGNPVTNKKYGI